MHPYSKALLVEKLNAIQAEYSLDASVQDLSVMNNYAGVNLCFHKVPSGISQTTASSVEIFAKEPGNLVFSQSYNGMVNVTVDYPKIDGIIRQSNAVVLATVAPEEIDEDFIEDKVVKFLGKLVQFEGSKYSGVGFQLAHGTEDTIAAN